MVKESKSRFLYITCSRCGNKQLVFGKATTRIKCTKCNKLLVKPRGGKVKIKTIVRKVLK